MPTADLEDWNRLSTVCHFISHILTFFTTSYDIVNVN